MRALSVKAPWAWAICHAGKRVENRDWPGGLDNRAIPRFCALHTSRATRFDLSTDVGADACDFIARITGKPVPDIDEHHPGHIVAMMMLGPIIHNVDEARAIGQEAWFAGPHAFGITAVFVLPTPVIAKGALNFWRVPGKAAELVLEQLPPVWAQDAAA